MQSDTTLLPAHGNDAIEILRNDHRVIKGLVRELVESDAASRKQVLEQLKGVLTIHNATEENLVYPAIGNASRGKDEAGRLYHQTAEADRIVFELDSLLTQRDGARFSATAKKFEKAVLAHIDEEENEAFPRLREESDPEQSVRLTEAVRSFRKSLRFKAASRKVRADSRK